MSMMSILPKVEIIDRCNLCDAPFTNATLVHPKDRYGFDVFAVRCTCGLVYLSSRLTASGYEDFYAHRYRPLLTEYHGCEYSARTIVAEQLEYAKSVGEFLDPCLIAGGVLLDIGGSTGVVARHVCDKFAMDGAVLDPCQDELDVAESTGLKTICGTIESARFEGNIGLVMMCRTIDHLLDIRGALTKIRGFMSDGGSFFVDALDYEKTREVKIDHPFNLNDRTMRRYLADAGFIVTRFTEAGKHLRYLCR